jgi:hypothetical protein
VTSTLASGVVYNVKAFVVVDGITVYGKSVQFTSQGSSGPAQLDFSPKTAWVYDTVLITGKGFSVTDEGNVVKFGELKAKVIQASENLLKVTVPDLIENQGPFTVSVATAGTKIIAGTFTLQPMPPMSVDKTSVKLCEVLTLTAEHALPPEGTSADYVIYFNNTTARPYLRDGKTLKVNVPFLPESTTSINVKLVVGNHQSLLPDVVTFRPLKINSFSPSSFTALTTLTVTGENLPACGLNAKINGQAVALQNISDTQFQFVVPAGVNGAFDLQLFMNTNYLLTYTID